MAEHLGPVTRTIIVAPKAQRQIDSLLRRSAQDFGVSASERYRGLINAALAALAEKPMRVTTVAAPVSRRAWMFHLRHARRMVAADRSVAKPRHFFVYRFDDLQLEIVQVLDDRMDLPQRLL